MKLLLWVSGDIMKKNNIKNRISMSLFTAMMFFGGKMNVFAVDKTCEGIMSPEVLTLIKDIYNTISVMMVVALVIFGILDFIQAIAGDKDDALKKAAAKFAKRAIIVMVIILLPVILDTLLAILWPDVSSCLDNI